MKRNKSREQYREMRVFHIQGFYVERGGKKKECGINALQKKKRFYTQNLWCQKKKKANTASQKKKLEYNLANREKRQKEVVDAEEHYERRSAEKKKRNIGI